MGRAFALLLVAGLAACAQPWDPPALRPYRGGIDLHGGHRLKDLTPYVLPWAGEVLELVCRWPEGPVPVHVPPDATPDEARAIEAAIDAWEALDLGLRFPRVAREAAAIRFELVPHRTGRLGGTGFTLADCAVDPSRVGADRVPARLVSARIRILRRDTAEWDARDHAFFASEVAGVALHEMAHALGFQGHATFGEGILRPDTRYSTRIGRRLLQGGGFDDPTLRALYGIPSGLVLARHPVPAVRTEWVDRLAARAPAHGLEGPWVRVGDRDGRVFWRGGEEWGVTISGIQTARAHPERIVLLPDLAVRRLVRGP